MKITKDLLKQLIKEEIEALVKQQKKSYTQKQLNSLKCWKKFLILIVL